MAALRPLHAVLPVLTRNALHPPLSLALRPSAFHRFAAATLPPLATTFTNLGAILSTLWESILRAVPKKKTTYARKRSRQMAGKALKDVHGVVPCHSCGRPKRPHYLCEHCALLVKAMWTGKFDAHKPVATPESTPERKALPSGTEPESSPTPTPAAFEAAIDGAGQQAAKAP